MAGVLFKKAGTGSSVINGVWLINATGDGTFIDITRDISVAGEAVAISGITSDAANLTLTLIGDRGVQYEPRVTVNGVVATRLNTNTLSASTDGTFQWTITVPSANSLSISTSDGARTSISVIREAPAIVSELTIVNNPNSNQTDFYRNSQTELKQGDEVYVSFKTDKPIVSVRGVTLSGSNCVGPGTYSGANLTYDVPSETYTVRLTVGRLTTSASQVTIQINTETTQGAVSSIPATTDNTVNCNNLYPTVLITSYTYPGDQSALKGNEQGTVSMTTANLDSILYTTPLNQITIDNPTTDEPTKTVTYVSGTYNVSITNFIGTANRLANDSTTTRNGIVYIVNVAPLIYVSEPDSALRSGGQDNTSPQTYNIRISSTQRLLEAPDLVAPVGTIGSMSWGQNSTNFDAEMTIRDTDVKGTYTWAGLLATGLSGLTTTVISLDDTVRVEGFVSREITLPAFGNTVTVNTGTFDLANITVAWSFQPLPLTRRLLDSNDPFPQEFFVSTTGTTTTIHLLNVAATTSSSQASSLTIEETI